MHKETSDHCPAFNQRFCLPDPAKDPNWDYIQKTIYENGKMNARQTYFVRYNKDHDKLNHLT